MVEKENNMELETDTFLGRITSLMKIAFYANKAEKMRIEKYFGKDKKFNYDKLSEEDLQNATKKAFEIDSIGVMAVIVLCMVVISLALAVCFISCSNEGVYTNNPTFFDLFYYTIITFATVGYGDISPVSPVAKFMSIIISMTSILCLTVFISSVLSYKNE